MQEKKDNEFNLILSKADIVEIISSYIELKPQGKNYFGVCPFHDDHSPSMSVSKDKQIYKCFVCGASGNAFKFVEDYLNIPFLEAVKVVSDKVGYNFKLKQSKEDIKNNKYYDVMELATLFYQNNLKTKDGKEAREYLKKRGITDEIIKDFSIGLAPNKNDSLYKLLSKKNIDKKTLSELGLIGESDNVYDLFRNRIMFPLKSPKGRVNGFSGRIYNQEGKTKYINTRETVVFKKRENLYNFHLAAPAARREKSLIICEGFMDAIRIYSIGVKNVVATMGTALAKEQIELLKSLNVKIIIVMDNDNAGEMATVSIGRDLLDNGIDIGIVRLTGKKDPDEYILANGPNAFIDNIKNPMNYYEFMEKNLRKDKNLNNSVELTSYINDMIKLIIESKDPLFMEIEVNKLANEFNLDKSLLLSRINMDEPIKEIKAPTKEKPKEKVKKSTKFDKAFKSMLYYMMNDTNCMRMFLRRNLDLPQTRYGLVVDNLVYYFELTREMDFASYISFVEDYEDVSFFVKEIIENQKNEDFKEEDMKVFLDIVENTIKEKLILEKKKAMQNELDISMKKKLFEEIIELKRGMC